jgi:hypothetical protein
MVPNEPLVKIAAGSGQPTSRSAPRGRHDCPRPTSARVLRGLLRALGLERRRAVARDEIELALLRRGGDVVARMGLDPRAFRIVCVPPDVYMGVGPSRGWGRREEWTHFDGYQVREKGRLLALVGGNARFGGIADLCGISSSDARDNTVVRLAVVRRERLATGLRWLA